MQHSIIKLSLALALSACASDGQDDPSVANPGAADTVLQQARFVREVLDEELVRLPLRRQEARDAVVTATLDVDTYQSGYQTVTFGGHALVLRPDPSTDLRTQDVELRIASTDGFFNYAPAFSLGVRVAGSTDVRWLSGSVNGRPSEFFQSAVISPVVGRVSFDGFIAGDTLEAAPGRSFYAPVADPGSVEYVVFPMVFFDAWDIQGDYTYRITLESSADAQ